MGALLVWLGRFFPYLVGSVAPAVFKKIVGLKVPIRLAVIAALFAAMPVPDWVSDLPGRVSALPDLFWFFAGLVKLRFGVSVIFGALVLRFIWREISKSV